MNTQYIRFNREFNLSIQLKWHQSKKKICVPDENDAKKRDFFFRIKHKIRSFNPLIKKKLMREKKRIEISVGEMRQCVYVYVSL